MAPTYSFPEVKSLVRSLDPDAVEILQQVIEEEKDLYADFELRAFQRFIKIQGSVAVRSELYADYLLSYN